MTDPIDLLDRLDTGRTPPPVEAVRRRGTQIRRRRTTALTLAAAAAVAVIATGSLIALGRPGATTAPIAPTHQPTHQPTSRTSATPTPRVDSADVLGADGYRDLKLGMTLQQAKDTGELTLVDAPGGTVTTGCAGFVFADLPAPGGQDTADTKVDGYYSAAHGLAAIFARPGMTTPEGIGLGSSWAEVHRTYPDGRFNADRYWIVPTGPGTAYEFGIERDDQVGEMDVMRTDQDCFG
ncbi:MAG TPA: hypothetical protein VFR99_06715 [Marmoricola sp.]|nr:hypothetical protein [Marmoricola sp.]